MSDFNKILAYDQIMPYLDQPAREAIANTLGMSIEEMEKRLRGKHKEDEFILILLFMDACKNITAFDEGVSQLLKTATSDLLIELKNGTKFMLEIKHTDKEEYSISSGNLQERIDYAKIHSLDLYFAISIKGFWMLFPSDYLKSKKGKISVTDYRNSKLDEIIGCYSYIFPPNLLIKSVYSTNTKKSCGIKFDPYGELVSYELYYNDRKIFRVKGKNSSYLGYSILLEALQDRMSVDSQTIVHDGNYTIITETFDKNNNIISEYLFLLSIMEHTVDKNGEKYTPHTYIENAKTDNQLLNNRFKLDHVRGVIQFLVNNGVEIMYIKNSLIYKIPPQE